MAQILQIAAVALLATGTGAATVSVMNEDIPDFAVPEGPWAPGNALDGRTFYTTDRIIETGEILQDELRFEDGGFQSVKCQVYCDFGWSEYQTWTEGETIHVTATAVCPEAPHTVVWYAKVTGDEISFEASWTTRRWYWTRQINAVGAGSETPPEPETVSG